MTIQRMSLLCLAILVLSSSLAVLGEDQAALKDRLRQAEVRSSLNTAGMSPWHLALSYSLLGPKGASSEEGTIEEWWASPTLYKIVFSTPSFTWTEIKNADGFYLSSGKERPDYILRFLLKQVVHPMPDDKQIDAAVPVIEKKKLGSVLCDCVMLSQPVKGFGTVAFGIYPTFCLDHDQTSFRLSSDYGTQIINRMVMGRFVGKSVPLDQVIGRNDVMVAKAHIAKLQTI